MMSRENRKQLADHVGERIQVSGYYDHSNMPNNYWTTLVQDCKVTLRHGTELDIGHCWVQYSDAIRRSNPARYAPVTFTAEITRYFKRTDNGESVQEYGLGRPFDVDCEDCLPEEPKYAPQPQAKPAPPRPSTAAIMRSVVELRRTLPNAKDVLPHLDRLNELVRDIGREELAELLGLDC